MLLVAVSQTQERQGVSKNVSSSSGNPNIKVDISVVVAERFLFKEYE
jgi:hypothetical protein